MLQVLTKILSTEELQIIFERIGRLYSKNIAEAFSRLDPLVRMKWSLLWFLSNFLCQSPLSIQYQNISIAIGLYCCILGCMSNMWTDESLQLNFRVLKGKFATTLDLHEIFLVILLHTWSSPQNQVSDNSQCHSPGSEFNLELRLILTFLSWSHLLKRDQSDARCRWFQGRQKMIIIIWKIW